MKLCRRRGRAAAKGGAPAQASHPAARRPKLRGRYLTRALGTARPLRLGNFGLELLGKQHRGRVQVLDQARTAGIDGRRRRGPCPRTYRRRTWCNSSGRASSCSFPWDYGPGFWFRPCSVLIFIKGSKLVSILNLLDFGVNPFVLVNTTVPSSWPSPSSSGVEYRRYHLICLMSIERAHELAYR